MQINLTPRSDVIGLGDELKASSDAAPSSTDTGPTVNTKQGSEYECVVGN